MQRLISSHVEPMTSPTLRDMSEVLIQKVATAMRCTCGHLWLTASNSKYPTCPRCHSTISRKKHAVILESETTRNQKQKGAESRSQLQNSAGVGESQNEDQDRNK